MNQTTCASFWLILLVSAGFTGSSAPIDVMWNALGASDMKAMIVLENELTDEDVHFLTGQQRTPNSPQVVHCDDYPHISELEHKNERIKERQVVWSSESLFRRFVTPNVMNIANRIKLQNYVFMTDSRDWYEMLSYLPMLVNTKLFLVRKDNGTLSVYEAYAPSILPSHNIRINFVCSSKVNDPLCNPMTGIWERRKDLGDVHLRALVEEIEPFTYIDERTWNIRGIFPDIFMQVQKHLNFTYDVKRSIDGTWGAKRNGSFTGMMGMLERNEADIIITMVVLSAERLEVMEPSLTIMKEGTRMFVKSSDSLKLNTTDLLKIFDYDVWGVMVAMIIVLSMAEMLVYISEKNRESSIGSTLDDIEGEEPLNIGLNSFAMVTMSLINKAHEYSKNPILCSGKILVVTVMILGVVFYACIRAGILSKLAVKKPRFEINSFQDALDSDYMYGTIPGGSIQNFYEKSVEGSVQKKLWDEKIQPHFNYVMFKDVKLALEAVAYRDHYIYTIYNNMALASPLYPCMITGTGPIHNMISTVFALRKNSPIVDLFNYYLMKLKENGVIDKVIRKYTGRARNAPDCSWTLDSRLGLEPVFGIFAILTLGVGLSFVLLLSENVGGRLIFGKKSIRLFTKRSRPPSKTLFRGLVEAIHQGRLDVDEKVLLLEELKKSLDIDDSFRSM